MRKKVKAVVARTAGELAQVLGLEGADGIEIAVRSALNTKVIEVIEKRRLTHALVASLAGTSSRSNANGGRAERTRLIPIPRSIELPSAFRMQQTSR